MCHHWEIAEAEELEEYDVNLEDVLEESPAERHEAHPEVDTEEEPTVEAHSDD